ncbi:hypothetical protein HAX54_043675 [Datura stramonium]|uniref:Uncharacterized protein n=1 Tax=Datura stramonium TaxID=4076 RepID=A0ABS8SPS8_DATST|nr:hypothetical protein [Datura stramonium]
MPPLASWSLSSDTPLSTFSLAKSQPCSSTTPPFYLQGLCFRGSRSEPDTSSTCHFVVHSEYTPQSGQKDSYQRLITELERLGIEAIKRRLVKISKFLEEFHYTRATIEQSAPSQISNEDDEQCWLGVVDDPKSISSLPV